MAAQVEPSAALEDLRWRCTSKRKLLHAAAVRQKRLRGILQICAAVIAILSGLVSIPDLVELTNSAFMKALSTLLAFASGCTSLYGSTYESKKDLGEMFKGAAELLSIRTNIRLYMCV